MSDAPAPRDPKRTRIAAEQFRKGNEAVPKGNWDYAIEMYRGATKMVPDNLMFRQALRAAEQKKYNGNGKGATMAGMRLKGTRMKIARAKFGRNWAEVEDAAEEGLTINPWDQQLNADLGEACKNLGYAEVAIFAYREALRIDSSDKGVNQALAELLESRGEYTEAVQCWQRILKLDPNNGAARTKISGLTAESVIDHGGYSSAENTRGVMADHEVKKRMKLDADVGPGQSVEADLLHAIRKEPANKDNYLKLGDYYRRQGELEKSAEQFQRGMQVAGGDANIRELYEDVHLELMRQNVIIAKERATQSPTDPTLKQRTAELARELLLREVEIFSARVERYPSDMKVKMELGKRFFQTQKFSDAIPLFQKARQDPRVKSEALVLLGKCFMYEKKYPIARRQLETAIPDVSYDVDPDVFKDLHYTLARLCEELKDLPAAENHYQEVLTVDYEYKDAVKRLDALQGGA